MPSLVGIKPGAGVWAILVIFLIAVSSTLSTVDAQKVHISSLVVPEVVLNGTDESIVLDCDYKLEREHSDGLVVNWYFNGQTVYQWIHKSKPQALGILKDKLNLDFKISDDDLTAYRAIQINNPTTELTGEYTCKVSTFVAGEAIMKGRMIVYAPPKDWGVKIISKPSASDFVNVTCWANGAFPEPKLTIYYGADRGERTLEEMAVESERVNGAYNVRVYKVIDAKEVVSPTVFDCELKMPNTSFVSRNHTLYTGPDELNDTANSAPKGVIECQRATHLLIPLIGLVVNRISHV